MSETGWPLIPRELLPAPVKPVRRPRPADPDGRPAPGRQLSIFGAETTEPSPADLAGLLAGPGRLQRMGGTARLIVAVDAGWRVHVLMNELVRRGLVVSWQPLAAGVGATPAVDEPAPAPGRAATRPAVPGRRPDPVPGGPIYSDDDLVDYDAGWDDEPASAAIGGGGGRSTGGGTESAVRGAAARPVEIDKGTEPGKINRGTEPGKINRETEPGEIGPEPDPGEIGSPAESDESDEPDDSGESGAIAAQWHVPLPVFEVRTAYSSRLNALARSWPDAAGGLFLSGPRMRLWVAAAGYPADDGFRLALTADQDPGVVDAALVRAGLAGSVADDRRSYLIMGERRLARLAELVGQRPAEAPPEVWPGGVPA